MMSQPAPKYNNNRAAWRPGFLLIVLALTSLPLVAQDEAPSRIEGAKIVAADWIMKKIAAEEEVIIVDSRIESEYREGHIPGAVNIDTDHLAQQPELLPRSKSFPIVFYCNGPKCMKSHDAALLAREWGYRKIYWFRGGVPEWKTNGYPLE
jgi:rhodanese-related sulfurtransferase